MIEAAKYLDGKSSVSEVTAAIQNAIDDAAAKGGDIVEVPAGEWIIRTLFIKSGVELRLCAGCTLKADDDLSQYPIVEEPSSAEELGAHYNEDRQPYHLIVMKDVENVAISGMGVIDGNGPAFWEPPAADSSTLERSSASAH